MFLFLQSYIPTHIISYNVDLDRRNVTSIVVRQIKFVVKMVVEIAFMRLICVTESLTVLIDLMSSDIEEPINIGSSEMVTIDELVSIVEEIGGCKLKRNYKLDAPKGVRGRNSDNTLIKKLLGWEPSIPLREGMKKTYEWIKGEMTR